MFWLIFDGPECTIAEGDEKPTGRLYLGPCRSRKLAEFNAKQVRRHQEAGAVFTAANVSRLNAMFEWDSL
ncbi:hypothetical protein ACFYYS_06130 [Streptomyces sp. NPDC002120]|uniref:hypothetical protein n=1 Tax=Streptomyces sp. NPDC002120 TaxID=3364631 RepID=UPI003690931B